MGYNHTPWYDASFYDGGHQHQFKPERGEQVVGIPGAGSVRSPIYSHASSNLDDYRSRLRDRDHSGYLWLFPGIF